MKKGFDPIKGVIDKLMVSFDQKLSLVRGELKDRGLALFCVYCFFVGNCAAASEA